MQRRTQLPDDDEPRVSSSRRSVLNRLSRLAMNAWKYEFGRRADLRQQPQVARITSSDDPRAS